MTTFAPGEGTPETLDDCQIENAQLREALKSRSAIDQAKGMLIAQHGCTPDEAFEMISAASQRANRKLRDIAVSMVESAQRG